jgi:hypothetical protein
MAKTVTDQAFGGKRIGLTMMAVICVPMGGIPDGKGRVKEVMQMAVHSGVCIDFDYDKDTPIFRSMTDLDVVAEGYRFVESEALLDVETWTWKERV